MALKQFYLPSMEDLSGISVQAAIRLSLAASNKPDDEIMAAMGWSRSTGNRIISNGDYWPSLPTLPRYCEAVSNFVLPQWIMANSNVCVDFLPKMDVPSLLTHVRQLMKEISEVIAESEKSLADSHISAVEARRVERQLEDMFKVAVPMLARLQAVINAAKGV